MTAESSPSPVDVPLEAHRRAAAQEELLVYGRERDGWVRAGLQGRWVAISGHETFGFFATQSEAYAQSVRHFADRTFVLMQVRPAVAGRSDLRARAKSKTTEPAAGT